MFNLRYAATTLLLAGCIAAAGSTLVAAEEKGVTRSERSANSADEAEIKRGRLLFLQCRACHEVAAGQPHKVGPNLHGFIGQAAARADGFKYSDALSKSNLTWDAATLDRWIKHPSTVVPGTMMAYVGMASETDRRALIAYLESATK